MANSENAMVITHDISSETRTGTNSRNTKKLRALDLTNDRDIHTCLNKVATLDINHHDKPALLITFHIVPANQ